MPFKLLPRRQFLKDTGRLIVYFSFLGPGARALGAPAESLPPGQPEATSLDSWLAVAPDGTITVFTSKVELGTGVETALAQMVAEELDVSFQRIKMDAGDTAKTIDQSVTAASRTIERGGPQLRQAAAAARQELLKLASVQLGVPAEKLTVEDGVVTVMGAPAKLIFLCGKMAAGKSTLARELAERENAVPSSRTSSWTASIPARSSIFRDSSSAQPD